MEAKAEGAGRIFRFEQQVIEELRAQRVFAALASDFGKKEAQRMFSVDSLPPVVASSSTSGGDEGKLDSSAGTEAGGMVDAPSPE